MSSAVQSFLSALQQNNYVSLVILVSVGYDYILMLGREVEYIWNKPWSWVSTLFIIVRYCGLLNLMITALVGTTFLPGPAKTYVFILLTAGPSEIFDFFKQFFFRLPALRGQILFNITRWGSLLFLGAADFVMILRVWAMYNRSKLVIGTLLALFSIEIISVIAAGTVETNPTNVQWNVQSLTINSLGYSFCSEQHTNEASTITKVTDTLQMTFAGVLCIFVILQFLRQSVQMYHVTRRLRLNRYTNLLVKEGVLYFFVIFFLNLISVLWVSGNTQGVGWRFILAAIVEYVPMYTLTPRFIISIRELYAHDVRSIGGSGIDSGFGLSMTSSRGGVGGGPIMFADGVQNDVVESVEPEDELNEA